MYVSIDPLLGSKAAGTRCFRERGVIGSGFVALWPSNPCIFGCAEQTLRPCVITHVMCHMSHVTHHTYVLRCAVLQVVVGLSERAGESLPFVLVAAKDDLGMSNVSGPL